MYATGEDELEVRTQPFVHPVQLGSERGAHTSVDGLFDGGAMVNSICNTVYPTLQNTLGMPSPSSKVLRMADGTRVPSQGRWSGDVSLGGRTVKESFEIFPSGGGWSLLFGKPLLEKFKAIHNYGEDTLKIPVNGKWSTIVNTCTKKNFTGESASILKGDDNSPSRQVLSSLIDNAERVDKQTKIESLVDTATNTYTNKGKQRPGRRARNKQKRDT